MGPMCPGTAWTVTDNVRSADLWQIRSKTINDVKIRVELKDTYNFYHIFTDKIKVVHQAFDMFVSLHHKKNTVWFLNIVISGLGRLAVWDVNAFIHFYGISQLPTVTNC